MTTIPDWRRVTDIVMAVPERKYEGWNSRDGYDNFTIFGKQYGWNGVAWCVMFDWCMYDDAQLESIVPKIANVEGFTTWAKRRGQWSEYPSVGAWVNFGNGAHTELVVGFDETYVYTKGGNSIEAGASDSGQGNGVWSHKTERRAARVTGYFAPRFPDGVCPPTADPNDPRGGKAVASWRYSKATPVPAPNPAPSKPKCPPFPGRSYFLRGATNDYAKQLQTWLHKGNWGPKYKVGPSRTMTELDLQKVKALQQHYLSALGPADGLCGPKTWQYAFEVANGLRKK